MYFLFGRVSGNRFDFGESDISVLLARGGQVRGRGTELKIQQRFTGIPVAVDGADSHHNATLAGKRGNLAVVALEVVCFNVV